MLKSYSKFILSVLALFFLFSCDKEPTEVTSGTAQAQTIVFSKTCSEGSLKITKETTAAVGVTASLNINDLSVGAEVTMSGTINKGGCGFTGLVSFSCRASVLIDTNRTFSCIAENFISGISNNLGTNVYSNPAAPNPIAPNPYNTTYQRSLISGKAHTYDNGTKTFVELQVSPSYPSFAPCPLSFSCIYDSL